MKIENNGRFFTVQETTKYWKLTEGNGALTVVYNVPKETASNIEELKDYISSNNIFS